MTAVSTRLSFVLRRKTWLVPVGLLVMACWPQPLILADEALEPKFVDLSLLVAPGYPCNWPTWPRFQINADSRIGPLSPYNVDSLLLDGNTGTQLDVPPHSVTPSDSGLPNAGPFGRMFTDVVPAWQFGGEACVVDCRDLIDTTSPGQSPLVKPARLTDWEKAHRAFGPGDVVLFRSGFSDKYYRPFPEGRLFAADPVEGKTPAWPDPDPACMEYLAARKVATLGTDSTSMGPLPDLAEPTHFAGLKHGMIWTESVTGLAALPATGAFYCMIGPKHAGGAFSEGRAFAVVGDPLARRLIESSRKKRVVDLSVVLADDLPVSWPGRGISNHRQPYMTVRFGLNPNTKTPFETHMLDSQAGTHLVPPSYALPNVGFDNSTYAPEVRRWLAEYETKFGPRGHSAVTTEQVPISKTCGTARVIDVSHLLGSTQGKNLPTSPEITTQDLKNYEKKHGDLHAGDIVLLRSGWSDRHFRPLPEGKSCMEDPLNGKGEGWPALGAEAVVYLAEKQVGCVGTDAPTLGGVDPKNALFTYWALGSKGMAGVEFLTNLGRMPEGAYFVFAAVKIGGCHGGPGRALAFY